MKLSLWVLALSFLIHSSTYANGSNDEIVMPPDWNGQDLPPEDAYIDDFEESRPTTNEPDCRPYEKGKASYYADSLTDNPTSSGEPYNPNLLTAAHKTLPLGTIVRVCNADRSQCVYPVKINDRGPFVAGRVIDLSRKSARSIGLTKQVGVMRVTVDICNE